MSGFESVDNLLAGSRETRKRADYLLRDRRVIVEQKVLQVDQDHRPQQFINRLIEQRRILFFGRLSTDTIFNKLPDGQELKREMFLSMTKGFEDDVAAADKQTRDTRAIFSIPDAAGIVVILNQGASALPPDLLGFGLNHVLNKRREDGSLRYVHNDGVVVISGTHVVPDSNGRPGMPCFATYAPHGRLQDAVAGFSEALLRGWASFNNLPAVQVTQDALAQTRAWR
jgi:hypothetical protein